MTDKIEEKIVLVKNKINKKVLSILVFALVGALIIFACDMTNNFKRQKQKTEDGYNKSLYEMVGYVNNAQVELAKLKVISTDNLKISTFAGIWRYSNLAKENLNMLPLEQNNIANTSKFLTQMSDFSYSLMNKLAKGEKISNSDEEQIEKIYDNCKKLSDTMQEIYEDLNTSKIKWNELQYVGNEKLNEDNLDTSNLSALDSMGKDFEEYEGLIYDGAFSEHVLSLKPKNLGDKVLTPEEVKEIINEKFKEEIESINYISESNGTIDLYNYEIKFKEYSDIKKVSATKIDGKIYQMISDREVSEEKLSVDEVKKLGLEFLKKLGIDDVEDTYYIKDSNMAIINYAGVQNDVILYPDLIKVKVALDNGEICSFESQGYIFNHSIRQNIVPSISIEEAKKIIKQKEYIKSERLAIIPTDSKSEVLVYEFKGKVDDTEFLVYVNANTGLEEKVLLILDTPGGILTI